MGAALLLRQAVDGSFEGLDPATKLFVRALSLAADDSPKDRSRSWALLGYGGRDALRCGGELGRRRRLLDAAGLLMVLDLGVEPLDSLFERQKGLTRLLRSADRPPIPGGGRT